MKNFITKNKRIIARQVLAVFVLSWFSLMGQATAHTFMMVERGQHKAMGHNMGGHCQPVVCETMISSVDQMSYGHSVVAVIDFNDMPVLKISALNVSSLINHIQRARQFAAAEFDPPPIQRSDLLLI